MTIPILPRRLRDVVRVQCCSDLEQESEWSAGSRLPRPWEGLYREGAVVPDEQHGQVQGRRWQGSVFGLGGPPKYGGCAWWERGVWLLGETTLFHPVTLTQSSFSSPGLLLPCVVFVCHPYKILGVAEHAFCFVPLRPWQSLCSLCIY